MGKVNAAIIKQKKTE